MSLISRYLITSLAVLAFSGSVMADEAPGWLRQAASVTVPTYDKEVSAVVLHRESSVSVTTEGNQTITENVAIRVLTREGRRYAMARALYLVSSGRVREMQAWMIRPNGIVKEYDRKTVVDIISDPTDVYNEYRLKFIDGTDEAETGAVFGYTVVSEDRPLYFQEKWVTQNDLPTLLSRYTLALPPGWKASGMTFNHEPVQPQVNGSNYTWELRNLPFIKDEPMGPSLINIVPWVAINYGPGTPNDSRTFGSWTDVSRWTTTLYDPQVIVDDAVAAKAQELTAGARSELEKIRAIAHYVQGLQYISIDIGVGSGNGYRPRPSTLVLSRGYGDCKDKANLMRALLKAQKIDSYPIAIYAGDPTFVRQEWSSPAQFNHAIIAVRVSDTTNVPTIISHEALGRLLIFDATDPDTSVGDLPEYLQGSYGLLIAGDKGGLVKMPLTPPETDLLERRVEVNLAMTGELTGKIRETAVGQASSSFRQELRSLSAADYRKAIEGWLTRGATGAQLINFTPKDRKTESAFDLDVEFSAPRYGQLMQNRLLIFKPVIVGRRNQLYLTENERKQPVILDSMAMKETSVFVLPSGFVVDEMPNPVSLEMPFGNYRTTYEVKEGRLEFTRTLTIRRSVLSVDGYKSVRDFYSKVREAEQSPVVLVRK